MLANHALPKQDEASKPGPGADEQTITVESRFGTLEIQSDDVLRLPNGLLGFQNNHDFGLAAIPDGQHPQFQVLQCLDAPDLAFLVAPLNIQSDAIDEDDLKDACASLGLLRESLAVLLIVTVRREGDSAQISVNMRAPLFVDIEKRIARQYVLPNNKYSIRHTL